MKEGSLRGGKRGEHDSCKYWRRRRRRLVHIEYIYLSKVIRTSTYLMRCSLNSGVGSVAEVYDTRGYEIISTRVMVDDIVNLNLRCVKWNASWDWIGYLSLSRSPILFIHSSMDSFSFLHSFMFPSLSPSNLLQVHNLNLEQLIAPFQRPAPPFLHILISIRLIIHLIFSSRLVSPTPLPCTPLHSSHHTHTNKQIITLY